MELPRPLTGQSGQTKLHMKVVNFVDRCIVLLCGREIETRFQDPISISIEAGILLGGKQEACFVLGVAGIQPMPS